MSGRRMRAARVAALVAGVAAACDGDDVTIPTAVVPTVTPGVVEVRAGDSTPLTIVPPSGARGGARVRWSSSAPEVAEPNVTETGLDGRLWVRGRRVGSAALTATVEGPNGGTIVVPVTVGAPTLPTGPAVLLGPIERTLRVGDTARFVATALTSTSASGGDTAFVFQSSDTTVATIDSTGLATARRVGRATIRAALRGVPSISGVAALTVVTRD